MPIFDFVKNVFDKFTGKEESEKEDVRITGTITDSPAREVVTKSSQKEGFFDRVSRKSSERKKEKKENFLSSITSKVSEKQDFDITTPPSRDILTKKDEETGARLKTIGERGSPERIDFTRRKAKEAEERAREAEGRLFDVPSPSEFTSELRDQIDDKALEEIGGILDTVTDKEELQRAVDVGIPNLISGAASTGSGITQLLTKEEDESAIEKTLDQIQESVVPGVRALSGIKTAIEKIPALNEGVSKIGEELQEVSFEQQQKARENSEDLLELSLEDPKGRERGKAIAQSLITNSPNTIGALVLGAGAGAVGGPIAAGATMFAYSAALEGGMAREQMRSLAKEMDIEVTEDQLNDAMIKVGIANGLLETIAPARFLNRLSKSGRRAILREVARNMFQTGLEESGTEFLQETVNNIVLREIDPERDLFEGSPEAGLVGGLMGLGLGGAGPVATSILRGQAGLSTEDINARIEELENRDELNQEEQAELIQLQELRDMPEEDRQRVIDQAQELQPLAEEAKQFDTAEEFVESKQFGEDIELVNPEALNEFREFDEQAVQKRAQEPSEQERLDELRESIKEEGIKDPIILTYNQTDNTLSVGEGNRRLSIAQELGISQVPVRVVVNRRTTGGVAEAPLSQEQIKENIQTKTGHIPQNISPSGLGIESQLLTDFFNQVKQEEGVVEEIEGGPTPGELGVEGRATRQAPFVRQRETTGLKNKIKNIGRGARIGEREGRRTVEERLDEINELIRESGLRPENKSELAITPKQIAKVKSEEAFQKIKDKKLEQIERLKTEQRQRDLKKDINKELKNIKPRKGPGGITRGKFGALAQERLLRVKKNIRGDRKQAMQKVVENIEQFSKSDESGQLQAVPDEVKVENKLLSMVGIQDMDVSELESTLENIQSLKSQGRLKQELKNRQRQRELNEVKDIAVSEIAADQDLKGGVTKQLNPVAKVIDSAVNSMLGYRQEIRKLTQFTEEKNLQNWVTDLVHNNRKLYTRKTRQLENMKAQAFSQFFGIKKKKQLKKVGRQIGEEKVMFEGKEGSGKKVTVKMSEAEVLAKLAQLKRLQGNGVDTSEVFFEMRNEDGNIEKMIITPEMESTLESGIRIELREFGKWVTNVYFPTVREFMNERFAEKYGVNMGKDPNYFPIRRADFDAQDETDLTLGDVFTPPPSALPSSVRAFTNSKLPVGLDGDFFDVLRRHTLQATHFVAFDPTVTDMRNVFEDTKVKDTIKEVHGEGILKRLEETINHMALGGTESRMKVAGIDTMIKNFTKSTLNFNPVPLIKQITSFPAFGGSDDINSVQLVTGSVRFMGNPIKWTRFLVNNSETIMSRLTQGFDRETTLAFRRGNWDAKIGETEVTIKEFIKKGLITPTRGGDMIPILPGMTAVYIKTRQDFLNQGLSEQQATEKAIERAELAALQTQQSPFVEDLAKWQQANSFFKAMAMYATTPIQYFRNGAEAVRALKNKAIGRGTEMSPAKALEWLTIYWIVLPQLFQLAANGGEWDEDDQRRSLYLAPFGLSYYPALGDMLGTIYDFSQGVEWKNIATSMSPLIDIPIKLAEGFGEVHDIFRDWRQGENIQDDVLAALEKFGIATSRFVGVPVSGPLRTGEGIVDLWTGETDDWRRLAYSSYALGEGTDKIENPDEVLTEEEAVEHLEKLGEALEEGDIDAESFERRRESFLEKQSRMKAVSIFREMQGATTEERAKAYNNQPEIIQDALDDLQEEQNEKKAEEIFEELKEVGTEQRAEVYEAQTPAVQKELDKLQDAENKRQSVLFELGRGDSQKDAEENTEKDVINQVINYSEAIGTDPVEAFDKLFKGEYVQKTENGAVIVYRLPFSESQAIRQYRQSFEVGANIEEQDLDHVVPRWLGGANDLDNLRLVDEDLHQEFTALGNNLRRKHRNGEISQQEAEDIIVSFKNGEITKEEAYARANLE